MLNILAIHPGRYKDGFYDNYDMNFVNLRRKKNRYIPNKQTGNYLVNLLFFDIRGFHTDLDLENDT